MKQRSTLPRIADQPMDIVELQLAFAGTRDAQLDLDRTLRELAQRALQEQREHYKRIEDKLDQLIKLNNELKGIAMTDQDTINQIASDLAAVKDEVNTVVTELGNVSTAGTNIEAELTKLIAAQGSGTPLDFSALQSAVSDLKTSSDTAKTSADNLVTLLPDPGAQSSSGTNTQSAS